MQKAEISLNEYSETTLEIKWSAFEHNLNYFKGLLNANTELMLMVKASAYGHSGIVFAQKIQEKKLANYLAVATLDEGILLRSTGIELPIMIQNPNKLFWEKLVNHCLEPVIFSFEGLHSFNAFLTKNFSQEKNTYPIHIKLNTGMNRLGFNESELNQLIVELEKCNHLRVVSIMSHLSSAGNTNLTDFTQIQLKTFERCRTSLSKNLSHSVKYHILNTDGINKFTDYQMDMVRLGIGLYGASEADILRPFLKPVAVLKTKVVAIRNVKPSDYIGYNRMGSVAKMSNIAILSLGYEDGLPRALGNGNWQVEINGELFPTIGNICMDLAMIDLGDEMVTEGEEVIIFGGIKSIVDYAEAQNTITYEALTNIGPRVKRVLV